MPRVDHQLAWAERALRPKYRDLGFIQVGSMCWALAAVLGVEPFLFRRETEELHAACFIPNQPEPHGDQR